MAHSPARASADPIRDWLTADGSAWVCSNLFWNVGHVRCAYQQLFTLNAFLVSTWESRIGISEDIAEKAMMPYDITSFPAGLPLYH